jgi:hypothetical protein
MKKPKNSNDWKEPSADSSKEIEAVLGDLDDSDDEIIDLDDVLEPYSEDGEEDEAFASDSDVEILSPRGSLGLRGFDDSAESDDDFILEDDLLKDLPFFQDEKVEAHADPLEDSEGEHHEELAPGLLDGIGEGPIEGPESQIEALILDERELEPFSLSLLETDEEDRAQGPSASTAAGPVVEEAMSMLSDQPLEGLIPDEVKQEAPVRPITAPAIEDQSLELPSSPAETTALEKDHPGVFVLPVAAPVLGAQETETVGLPGVPSTGPGISTEDFVAQLETKILGVIREIVEARLPDIVRSVLREEIEALKSDQEQAD